METCVLRHFVVKFAGHRLAISAQRAAVAPSNEAWAFGLLHRPQYFGGFCCCGHEKAVSRSGQRNWHSLHNYMCVGHLGNMIM